MTYYEISTYHFESDHYSIGNCLESFGFHHETCLLLRLLRDDTFGAGNNLFKRIDKN